MNKAEKSLLKTVAPTMTWTPVPYKAYEKEIDSLVQSGEIIYDPRCEAAMLPDVWERAPQRVQSNEAGWEALQRAENPEAHVFRPETPPATENAENAS